MPLEAPRERGAISSAETALGLQMYKVRFESRADLAANGSNGSMLDGENGWRAAIVYASSETPPQKRHARKIAPAKTKNSAQTSTK